jgi:Protein of unknown function (DUF2752)
MNGHEETNMFDKPPDSQAPSVLRNSIDEADNEELVEVELVESEDLKNGIPPQVSQPTLPDAFHPSIDCLPKQLRWLCLLMAIGVLGLLAISRSLTPSRIGFGTHQQLGLPPCTSLLVFGSRCPACGMTTSWALATRGEFAASISTNAGGFLLALIALAFIPFGCYFFATGRVSRGFWFSTLLTVCLITALAMSILQWLVRLLS